MKSTLTQKLGAALLGLSLAGAVSNADTTNLISLTTFEAGESLRYNFPYSYNWGFTWPGSAQSFFTDMEPPDYTNNLGHFSFDNSLVAPFFPDPAAGYGFGFGGGLNWDFDIAKFGSTNREDYIVEFDCKVEGLFNSVTSGNGEFQIRFDAPDDTLAPPDANGDADVLVQHNYGFSAGSNWTHYVFTLDLANVDGNGNWDRFLQYKDVMSDVRFGCNWHQPDPSFGFDDDNHVFIDNVKVWVIERVPVVPLPKVPFAILDWNMDDKGLGYAWSAGTNGGWSENGVRATYLIDQPNAGSGVGGSNAMLFWMLNEIYETNSPLPNWGGGNAGFGGPGDYSHLTSGDLVDYRFSLDARLEGLNPAAAGADVDFQLSIIAPDGTVGATDGNSDRLVRLDFTISGVSSNWQHKEVLLSKATAGDGTLKATFTAHYAAANEINMQVQLNNVTQTNLWQFDNDNKVFLDNIKLERLAIGCPPLSVQTIGNEVVVSWANAATGTTKLLGGNTLTTVTTEIIGATSPHTNAISAAPKYFRTLWVPPTP